LGPRYGGLKEGVENTISDSSSKESGRPYVGPQNQRGRSCSPDILKKKERWKITLFQKGRWGEGVSRRSCGVLLLEGKGFAETTVKHLVPRG